jgi:hypothetical protein
MMLGTVTAEVAMPDESVFSAVFSGRKPVRAG